MPTLHEITGKFLRERHRFESEPTDVIIADVHCADASGAAEQEPVGHVSIKGPAEFGSLTAGIRYRFFGRWTKYKGQPQFSFNSFVALQPADRESIIAYLASHGAGYGLGKVRAARLWEMFGQDAVRIARTDPACVSKELTSRGLRYSEANARGLASTLAADEAVEAIKLDLTMLLGGRGFPKQIVNTIIQEWGNRGAMIVRRNPYRLLKFGGCGFKRCDAMYLDLNLSPTRLKRQALCAWYSLEQNTDGHTWYDWRTPDAYLRTNISSAGVKVDRALELATRAHLLDEAVTAGVTGPIIQGGKAAGSVRWFADSKQAANERSIAEGVLRAQSEPHNWPGLDGLELKPHQIEVASKALQSSICVLGGSPGTGKTWVVSELVKSLADSIGLGNILVGAPTGKAAVRVTENLSAKEIPLRARTWHSLLMQLELKKLEHFPAKVLIGDESSMLDTDLMAAVMRARSPGTMMLMVGDVNQLPPVGHGAPLRDLIASGVAYGELTQIIRNSGGIVEACAAMREGRRWEVGDNLNLVASGADVAVDRIYQIVHSAKGSKLDPVWDVQIVTAVNEKSPLSRVELNKHLQRLLNKQPGEEGVAFRRGDKVVNTKNGFFKIAGATSLDDEAIDTNDRDEVYVANGELAKVVAVDRKSMTLSLEAPARRIQVYFGQEGGCTFELGYALSVHKSQGSDWPWVVVVLDDYPGARMVCDRSWLYTAISRAKHKCWLVGQRATADRMCRTSKIWHRKTFLRELILQGQAIRSLADV